MRSSKNAPLKGCVRGAGAEAFEAWSVAPERLTARDKNQKARLVWVGGETGHRFSVQVSDYERWGRGWQGWKNVWTRPMTCD